MPKVVDPDKQREEIRAAARRVFSAKGISGTGLAQVASAAGMGRSSLYHYYPDKDALVRDLARETLDREEAVFLEALEWPGTALERIERLLLGMPEIFDAWGAIGSMLPDLRRLDQRRVRSFFRTIRKSLATLIEAGQKDDEFDPSLDPKLVSASLIGMIDGLLLQVLVDRRAFADEDSLRRTLAEIVRRALRP
jgi:AcrR family transcriptional regulator